MSSAIRVNHTGFQRHTCNQNNQLIRLYPQSILYFGAGSQYYLCDGQDRTQKTLWIDEASKNLTSIFFTSEKPLEHRGSPTHCHGKTVLNAHNLFWGVTDSVHITAYGGRDGGGTRRKLAFPGQHGCQGFWGVTSCTNGLARGEYGQHGRVSNLLRRKTCTHLIHTFL